MSNEDRTNVEGVDLETIAANAAAQAVADAVANPDVDTTGVTVDAEHRTVTEPEGETVVPEGGDVERRELSRNLVDWDGSQNFRDESGRVYYANMREVTIAEDTAARYQLGNAEELDTELSVGDTVEVLGWTRAQEFRGSRVWWVTTDHTFISEALTSENVA